MRVPTFTVAVVLACGVHTVAIRTTVLLEDGEETKRVDHRLFADLIRPDRTSKGCADKSFILTGQNYTCLFFEGERNEECDSHNDDDFTAGDMCCACGGGEASPTRTTLDDGVETYSERVPVVSTLGFKVNDQILIEGGGIAEVRTIAAVSSKLIEVRAPLVHDYGRDSTVTRQNSLFASKLAHVPQAPYEFSGCYYEPHVLANGGLSRSWDQCAAEAAGEGKAYFGMQASAGPEAKCFFFENEPRKMPEVSWKCIGQTASEKEHLLGASDHTAVYATIVPQVTEVPLVSHEAVSERNSAPPQTMGVRFVNRVPRGPASCRFGSFSCAECTDCQGIWKCGGESIGTDICAQVWQDHCWTTDFIACPISAPAPAPPAHSLTTEPAPAARPVYPKPIATTPTSKPEPPAEPAPAPAPGTLKSVAAKPGLKPEPPTELDPAPAPGPPKPIASTPSPKPKPPAEPALAPAPGTPKPIATTPSPKPKPPAEPAPAPVPGTLKPVAVTPGLKPEPPTELAPAPVPGPPKPIATAPSSKPKHPAEPAPAPAPGTPKSDAATPGLKPEPPTELAPAPAPGPPKPIATTPRPKPEPPVEPAPAATAGPKPGPPKPAASIPGAKPAPTIDVAPATSTLASATLGIAPPQDPPTSAAATSAAAASAAAAPAAVASAAAKPAASASDEGTVPGGSKPDLPLEAADAPGGLPAASGESSPGSPTPPPTPTSAQAEAPSPAPAASASGDSHVTNVDGVRFNIAKTGVYEFLRLPRRLKQSVGPKELEPLLSVWATVEHAEEDNCTQLYLRQVDVAGGWLRSSGPFRLRVEGEGLDVNRAITLWVNGSLVDSKAFGRNSSAWPFLKVVEAKIPHVDQASGHLQRVRMFTVNFEFSGASLKIDWVHRAVPGGPSLNHLNFQAVGLHRFMNGTGMDVGGILGRDDHSDAASLPKECKLAGAADLRGFDRGSGEDGDMQAIAAAL